MAPQEPFSRRENADLTQDSICMKCFLTVATGSELELIEAEPDHDCERSIQTACARSEHFAYGLV
jgi:hypothetical protein